MVVLVRFRWSGVRWRSSRSSGISRHRGLCCLMAASQPPYCVCTTKTARATSNYNASRAASSKWNKNSSCKWRNKFELQLPSVTPATTTATMAAANRFISRKEQQQKGQSRCYGDILPHRRPLIIPLLLPPIVKHLSTVGFLTRETKSNGRDGGKEARRMIKTSTSGHYWTPFGTV